MPIERNQITNLFISFLQNKTDKERLEAISEVREKFCLECGGRQPFNGICQCWNDE